MNWKYLFGSFDGRIGRQKFWISAIILLVVSLLVGWALHFIGLGTVRVSSGMVSFDNGNSMQFSRSLFILSPLGGILHTIIMLWPVAAVSLKRRHDKGSPGYDVLVFLALNVGGELLLLLGLAPSHILVGPISLVTSVLGVYLLVVMGFLKGEDGPNKFGPDPLDS